MKASEHIAGHYKVVKTHVGILVWQGRTVNLSAVTLKEAQELVALGFPYLQPVDAKGAHDSVKKKSKSASA